MESLNTKTWGMMYGSWWALQWSKNWFLSVGIHINFKRRVTNEGVRYGPYVDLHVFFCIVSFGVNPIWAGEEHKSVSAGRGGKFD